VSIRSFRAAVSFLTVLPVANLDGSPGERLGRAYFPLVGALVGLIAWLVFALVSALSTPLLAAAACVAALSALTGALHLDGLADSADGLLGRTDVAQRLQTMRDPRLGSYGVVAIVAVLLLNFAALASISPARALAALIVAGALSRLATLWVVVLVPYVRSSGLGVAALDPGHRRLDLGVGSITALIVCLLDWRRSAIAAAVVALTALLVVTLARRRIGGATGDVYGATAELCQMAALVVFAAR
jgi:adenosylcobinamide-GDP ribazoletransferase